MRAFILVLVILSLSGASVMAQSRDPQLDPHIFDNLDTRPPFSWLSEPSPRPKPLPRSAPQGEKHDGPAAPLPKDRPPHIKPEWEAKLPEWEKQYLKTGELPDDPEFYAYMVERDKQLMQNPEWRRMIEQRTEELRAIINEQMTGVPEEAM